MADNEIERLTEALRLTKERLEDLVAIERARGPLDEPYSDIAILTGTARRIGHVLEGRRFHWEYGS